MRIVLKMTFILFIWFAFISVKVFAQKNTNVEDLRIYREACKIDHYPENIRNNTNESALAYCQIYFKNGNENDSIVIYNTLNEEIISLITQCVKKINFSKKYRKQSSIVIPYIFKNGDEYKNVNIALSVRQNNLQLLYGKAGSTEINSLIFIRPVIIVGNADGPNVR